MSELFKGITWNTSLTEWPKDNSASALESPVIAGGGGGGASPTTPAILNPPSPPVFLKSRRYSCYLNAAKDPRIKKYIDYTFLHTMQITGLKLLLNLIIIILIIVTNLQKYRPILAFSTHLCRLPVHSQVYSQ